MMYLLCAAALLSAFSSHCSESMQSASNECPEISAYDVDAWEGLDTDYDQICEVAEYEKPSALMIWLRSVGGAMYVGLCSAREYVVAKWYAMQKALGFKKRKLMDEVST